MTLDTYVDGKGPFHFMVDTGADRSVIAHDVAAKLGLVDGGDVVVQGISRSMPATTVALKNLTFGQITVDRVHAPVLPREFLRADGYLGLDVIDGRKVTFDFIRDALKVEQSDGLSSWFHPNEAIMRVDGSHGRLMAVDCLVEGVQAFAFIDSGAQMSIGNSHLFAALQDKGKTYFNDDIVPVYGVTGGQSTGRIAAISDIHLGSLEFRRSYLVISDLPVFDVWGLTNKPALFIGMNFLCQTSAFTIDFARKEFRFKLANLRIASRA